MCMLTFYPESVQPDTEALTNGAEVNNDGHGFAIVSRSRRNPIVRRYLDSELAIEEFARLRQQFDDGPAMFHSRWGTAGENGEFNVHPFRIDRRTVIAHNGVLPAGFQPETKDRRCDTRLYAEDILRGEDLSNVKVRNRIADEIGSGNKFVILSTRSDYNPAYIINEKQGTWEGDAWYSNQDYLGWWNKRYESKDGSVYRMTSTGKFEYIPTSMLCRYCKGDDLDFKLEVCLECDACQDCGQNYWGQCMCFNPTRLSKDIAA